MLEEQKIVDFDGLFDLIWSIDWKQYISSGYGVRVLANSHESQLSSARTIQSIAHKSIVTQLTGSRDVHWEQDESKATIEISVDIYKDMTTILLNTSGASLHERGYRTEQGEAPLKENIAAWLLVLSGWDKKSPLFDPFCGSGTICIEAAMLAAGIAPGLLRRFSFENFGFFDGFVFSSLRDDLMKQPITKEIKIFGSDIDTAVLQKAKANADRAGVGHMINFQERHFLDVQFRAGNIDKIWCVTNPPYGVRLGQESEELVEDLVASFATHRLFGGFLLLRGAKTIGFSSIELLNWQQEVCFYKK